MTLGHDLRQVRAGLSFWQRRKLEFAVGLLALALLPLALALVPALAGLYLLPGAAIQRLKTVLSGKLMDQVMGDALGGMSETISTAVPGDHDTQMPMGMNLGDTDGDPTEEPVYDPEVEPSDMPGVDEMEDLHEGFASHMSDRNTPDEDE